MLEVGAYAMVHEVGDSVRVHDVAEFINHIYANTNELGYVKQYGDNNITVFGGNVYNYLTGGSSIIADTEFEITTNGTYYLYIDVSDYSIQLLTTAPTELYYMIATIVIAGGVITSITDTRGINLTQGLPSEII